MGGRKAHKNEPSELRKRTAYSKDPLPAGCTMNDRKLNAREKEVERLYISVRCSGIPFLSDTLTKKEFETVKWDVEPYEQLVARYLLPGDAL
jgi:hypothetical protein